MYDPTQNHINNFRGYPKIFDRIKPLADQLLNINLMILNNHHQIPLS